jgi:nucleotide-binding universal stress UspA family protein
MAKRILVPISSRMPSDAFLSALGDLARGAAATVRLLHVAEPPTDVTGNGGRAVREADHERFRLHAEARDILELVNLSLGGSAETTVRVGDPTAEILAEAAEFAADLIAMGIGDRKRFHFHSGVAWDILRRAEVPVALLRSARLEGAASPS